jgi:hypothetical protein
MTHQTHQRPTLKRMKIAAARQGMVIYLFYYVCRVLPMGLEGGGSFRLLYFSRDNVSKARTTTGLKYLENRHKPKFGCTR